MVNFQHLRLPVTNLVGTLLALSMLVSQALAQDSSGTVYLLHVDGLACPFCAYGLEKRLTKIPDIDGIETDIETGTIRVTMAADRPLDAITAAQAVEDAGFSLRDFETVTSKN